MGSALGFLEQKCKELLLWFSHGAYIFLLNSKKMPVDSLLLQGINTPQRSHSSISSLSLGSPLGCFLVPLLWTFSLRDIERRSEDSGFAPCLVRTCLGRSSLANASQEGWEAGGRGVEIMALAGCKLGVSRGQGKLICIQSPDPFPWLKALFRLDYFLMI